MAQRLRRLFQARWKEAVSLPLGGSRVVQFQEAVVLLHEAGPFLDQLLRQPIVPVHVNLDREGEPGFDPHVDPPELRIEEVVVHHPLRAARECQARLAIAVAKLDRAAAFDATQHGNQAGRQLPLADDLINQFLFGVLALEILVGSTLAGGCGLGVLDQPLRPRL